MLKTLLKLTCSHCAQLNDRREGNQLDDQLRVIVAHNAACTVVEYSEIVKRCDCEGESETAYDNLLLLHEIRERRGWKSTAGRRSAA